MMTYAWQPLAISGWGIGITALVLGTKCCIQGNHLLAVIWLAVALTGTMLLITGWNLKKKKQRDEHSDEEQIAGRIDPEGIFISQTAGETRLSWAKLNHYRIMDSALVLYDLENEAYYFPRTFFATENDWLTFRAQIHRRLIPREVGEQGRTKRIFIYSFVAFLMMAALRLLLGKWI